jgi:hypothetical protein
MDLNDPKLDDTKPEYWEGMGKHYAPKNFDTVDLPKERWPDLNRWAWDVFMRQIWDFDGKKYANYRVQDIRHMFTNSERRIWLWDHAGNGDSVRISSEDMSDRLIVVFDHESGRSPWSKDGDEGLAPGLDFLDDLRMAEILQSDIFPFSKDTPAMTEAYRFKFSYDRIPDDFNELSEGLQKIYLERFERNPDRIITSPEVLALGNDFSREDEFGPVTEDERKWLTPQEIKRRELFVLLYEQLLRGELPTLKALHKLLKDDLVTATAFDAMWKIYDLWLPSPEERHRRWREHSGS